MRRSTWITNRSSPSPSTDHFELTHLLMHNLCSSWWYRARPMDHLSSFVPGIVSLPGCHCFRLIKDKTTLKHTPQVHFHCRPDKHHVLSHLRHKAGFCRDRKPWEKIRREVSDYFSAWSFSTTLGRGLLWCWEAQAEIGYRLHRTFLWVITSHNTLFAGQRRGTHIIIF